MADRAGFRALSGRLRVGIPAAIACLLNLPKVFWPDAFVYRELLTSYVLLVVSSLFKLAALGLGAVLAAKSARRLERDNPARGPWELLAAFLGSFFCGQVILSGYPLVLHRAPPLPSLGDAFFVVGYLLVIAASVRFVFVYRASGFPLGHRYEHPALAALATVVFIAIGAPMLAPIVATPQPVAERMISVAYPILDFVTLVPVIVLARIASFFVGGRVFRVWATLSAGLVFASAGDILFAVWAVTGKSELEPVVDATLMASYALLASGAAFQHELLVERERRG